MRRQPDEMAKSASIFSALPYVWGKTGPGEGRAT